MIKPHRVVRKVGLSRVHGTALEPVGGCMFNSHGLPNNLDEWWTKAMITDSVWLDCLASCLLYAQLSLPMPASLTADLIKATAVSVLWMSLCLQDMVRYYHTFWKGCVPTVLLMGSCYVCYVPHVPAICLQCACIATVCWLHFWQDEAASNVPRHHRGFTIGATESQNPDDVHELWLHDFISLDFILADFIIFACHFTISR